MPGKRTAGGLRIVTEHGADTAQRIVFGFAQINGLAVADSLCEDGAAACVITVFIGAVVDAVFIPGLRGTRQE